MNASPSCETLLRWPLVNNLRIHSIVRFPRYASRLPRRLQFRRQLSKKPLDAGCKKQFPRRARSCPTFNNRLAEITRETTRLPPPRYTPSNRLTEFSSPSLSTASSLSFFRTLIFFLSAFLSTFFFSFGSRYFLLLFFFKLRVVSSMRKNAENIYICIRDSEHVACKRISRSEKRLWDKERVG